MKWLWAYTQLSHFLLKWGEKKTIGTFLKCSMRTEALRCLFCSEMPGIYLIVFLIKYNLTSILTFEVWLHHIKSFIFIMTVMHTFPRLISPQNGSHQKDLVKAAFVMAQVTSNPLLKKNGYTLPNPYSSANTNTQKSKCSCLFKGMWYVRLTSTLSSNVYYILWYSNFHFKCLSLLFPSQLSPKETCIICKTSTP